MTTTSHETDVTAKLITYLDEYKMASISSQLFEGLTQEIVQYAERSEDKSEQQRGPVASGRLEATVIGGINGKTERRSLLDYAYTVFEKRLAEDGRVLAISDQSRADDVFEVGSKSFIRVTGQLRLNDLAAVKRTTTEFNTMIAALNYITGASTRDALAALLRLQIESAEGKARYELEKQLKAVLSPKVEPVMDPKYLEQLAYMFDFGYGDHLEAQIRIGNAGPKASRLFTAILDRASLREDAATLVKKYSRLSEVPFTVLGLVTQHTRKGDWNASQSSIADATSVTSEVAVGGSPESTGPDDGSQQKTHLKAAITQLIEQLGNVEDTFFGRLADEVIIDPIAIYREL